MRSIVSPLVVRDALDRLEDSWTRPRRELPPNDPESYRKRLSAIVEAVTEADEETSVLVEDETTLRAVSFASAHVATRWGAAGSLGAGRERWFYPLRHPGSDFRGAHVEAFKKGLQEGPI